MCDARCDDDGSGTLRIYSFFHSKTSCFRSGCLIVYAVTIRTARFCADIFDDVRNGRSDVGNLRLFPRRTRWSSSISPISRRSGLMWQASLFFLLGRVSLSYNRPGKTFFFTRGPEGLKGPRLGLFDCAPMIWPRLFFLAQVGRIKIVHARPMRAFDLSLSLSPLPFSFSFLSPPLRNTSTGVQDRIPNPHFQSLSMLFVQQRRQYRC